MTGEGAERHKLAAVMFTDMVGYSALAGSDEALALELLDIHHALIRQCLRRHQGRAIKTIGDAFMVEFSSAISAVDCAIEIQAQLNELNLSQKEGRRIDHRIGIHLGDVVERQEDLLGDGVNIAARLEPLAHPGAICVSEDVANQLRSRPRYQLEDLGLLELKNIPRPIRGYLVHTSDDDPASSLSHGGTGQDRRSKRRMPSGSPFPNKPRMSRPRTAPMIAGGLLVLLCFSAIIGWWVFTEQRAKSQALNFKPTMTMSQVADRLWSFDPRSVAVLPFENLNRDDEMGVFANGIHHDILTQLAKIRALKVISRTSVLKYALQSRNLRRIARELGVATILEGAVQRAGGSIRINVQLIDGSTDKHLWAETYDRELTIDSIFAIQSEIARIVAAKLRAKMSSSEQKLIDSPPTRDFEAYDAYLRGKDFLARRIENPCEFTKRAQQMFERAVELDPTFALACASMSRIHYDIYVGLAEDRPQRYTEAPLTDSIDWANRALEIDSQLPEAHLYLGKCFLALRDHDRALPELTIAENSLPNDVVSLEAAASLHRYFGRWEKYADLTLRIALLDPLNAERQFAIGYLYSWEKRYDEAERFYDRALALAPEFSMFQMRKAYLPLLRHGDTTALRELLEKISRGRYDRWYMAFIDRDYATALAHVDEIEDPLVEISSFHYPVELFRGLTLTYAGSPAEAEQSYRQVLEILRSLLSDRPNDFRLMAPLGIALAGLGRKEEAIQEGHAALRIRLTHRDRSPTFMVLNLAWIYAMVDEPEEAIAQFDHYLGQPSFHSLLSLTKDPRMDRLREHRDFRALTAKYGRL